MREEKCKKYQLDALVRRSDGEGCSTLECLINYGIIKSVCLIELSMLQANLAKYRTVNRFNSFLSCPMLINIPSDEIQLLVVKCSNWLNIRKMKTRWSFDAEKLVCHYRSRIWRDRIYNLLGVDARCGVEMELNARQQFCERIIFLITLSHPDLSVFKYNTINKNYILSFISCDIIKWTCAGNIRMLGHFIKRRFKHYLDNCCHVWLAVDISRLQLKV